MILKYAIASILLLILSFYLLNEFANNAIIAYGAAGLISMAFSVIVVPSLWAWEHICKEEEDDI